MRSLLLHHDPHLTGADLIGGDGIFANMAWDHMPVLRMQQLCRVDLTERGIEMAARVGDELVPDLFDRISTEILIKNGQIRFPVHIFFFGSHLDTGRFLPSFFWCGATGNDRSNNGESNNGESNYGESKEYFHGKCSQSPKAQKEEYLKPTPIYENFGYSVLNYSPRQGLPWKSVEISQKCKA